MNTITTQSSGIKFKQGYFEVRMRWTDGAGSWPGFWLFSYAHATNPVWPQPACPIPNCLAAELDVMEGQGSAASEPLSSNDFYGTIHRNAGGQYGVPDQLNGNNWQRQSFKLADNWHTYAAKWTSNQICWYLDNVQSHCATPYDSFNQDMFLLLNMWSGGWTVDPGPTTPNELHTEVDSVRVWQR
jgi:beta-glucanase (GH16 family)